LIGEKEKNTKMTKANLILEDIYDPRFRTICEQIMQKMDEMQVPGVALGILCDGVQYTAGLGITSIQNPQPVTSHTLFEIGSTGKTFTAVAVMRLVEQGKMDLDTPLRTYLPELNFTDQQATQHATMRHLLTHTGGWLGDHFQDFGNGDDVLARYVASLKEIPQISPLGEVFSYCNSGFILAGRVIEAVTGQVYEQAMRELVLDPLGMKDSYYFAHEMMNFPFATGHHNEPGTNKPVVANPWPVPRFAAPAGGVITNIHDQLKYARFLMGNGMAEDGTRLLKAETLALMRTPQASAGGGLGEEIGLSLILRTINGVQIAAHGGSINGQQSDFQMVPSRQFALALTTNADNGVFLHIQMTPIILETFLGLKAPEPTYLEMDAGQLAEYVGEYTRTNGSGYTIALDAEGYLTATSNDEENPDFYVLRFIDKDLVVITNPPAAGMRCDFVRGREGEIRWFRESGRIAQRFEE
jgi:CubicO group peptidase (beta-lactamase class C family)